MELERGWLELCFLTLDCPEKGRPDGDPGIMASKLRTESLGLLTPWEPHSGALTQACQVALMSPFPSLGLCCLIAVTGRLRRGRVHGDVHAVGPWGLTDEEKSCGKACRCPISLVSATSRWAGESGYCQELWEGLAMPHPGTQGLW